MYSSLCHHPSLVPLNLVTELWHYTSLIYYYYCIICIDLLTFQLTAVTFKLITIT